MFSMYLVISCFGFEGMILVLIAQVPDHYLLFVFCIKNNTIIQGEDLCRTVKVIPYVPGSLLLTVRRL